MDTPLGQVCTMHHYTYSYSHTFAHFVNTAHNQIEASDLTTAPGRPIFNV